MIGVSMAKLTEKIPHCSAAVWQLERRIYMQVPIAVFVPLSAAFTN